MHGITKDVPIDFLKHVMEKVLGNDTELKWNQRSSHPVPVLELLFRSEAENDIANPFEPYCYSNVDVNTNLWYEWILKLIE